MTAPAPDEGLRAAVARALWLHDDYDLDADPTSRTAREYDWLLSAVVEEADHG